MLETSRIIRFQVLNRIAVEELEAWFFGDVQAIHQAYERVSSSLIVKSAYRDPDAIKGGTWRPWNASYKGLAISRAAWPKLRPQGQYPQIWYPLAIVPGAFRHFSKDYWIL